MTKQEAIKAPVKKPEPTGLDLLRVPFPENQISKLPKPTKAQTDAVRADYKKGIRCKICGQWHHPQVVHLDYVGHAALTDRLLDCDPQWNWEPLAFTERGTPLQDENGGMWIKLTVCGVTRYGYGHPDGKRGGDAIKEVIGDALRNAAMRFGAALDLWHKGQLHADPEADEPDTREDAPKANHRTWAQTITDELHEGATTREKADAVTDALIAQWKRKKSHGELRNEWDRRTADKTIPWLEKNFPDLHASIVEAYESRIAQLDEPAAPTLEGDEIPY